MGRLQPKGTKLAIRKRSLGGGGNDKNIDVFHSVCRGRKAEGKRKRELFPECGKALGGRIKTVGQKRSSPHRQKRSKERRVTECQEGRGGGGGVGRIFTI